MTYAGDAIFVLDPDRNNLDTDTMYRMGLACMAMGFNAFGLNLVRESALVSPADIDAIEAQANRVRLSRKLVKAWRDVPDYVYSMMQALRPSR